MSVNKRCKKCNYLDNTVATDGLCSTCTREGLADKIHGIFDPIRLSASKIYFELDRSVSNGRPSIDGIEVWLYRPYAKINAMGLQPAAPIKVFGVYATTALLQDLAACTDAKSLVLALGIDELLVFC